uniref:Bm1057 n=1 Tax=Brugia malayi TaxID=6279 RepID=A0A1I9G3W7_BRUMA|nr:Bm1057 [Brugia malayi]
MTTTIITATITTINNDNNKALQLHISSFMLIVSPNKYKLKLICHSLS